MEGAGMIRTVVWMRAFEKTLSTWDVYSQYAGEHLDLRKLLADFIKRSEDDSFVFILTRDQLVGFDLWVKTHDMEEYIMERSELIANPVHPYNGRNLQIVVMVSKEHFYRELFEQEEESNETRM